MAGTRWVLGALLRGRGCGCNSCRQTGAACLPLRPAAPASTASASALSGRRRLLLLLGAQSRGLQVAAAAASLPSPAGPGLGALRGPLLPQAHPARSYCQETNNQFSDTYPQISEYEPAPPKADEEDDAFLIRAQGLPYTCSEDDVLNFFVDCKIRNGARGIHFLLNRDGRRRGDALIELESEQDVLNALDKHRKYMGQRYIEVFEVHNEDVEALLKRLQVSSAVAAAANDGVVRLRGLPYGCTITDVSEFFSGLAIVDIIFVMDQRGRKTGEAFVQFATPEMANQALLKHRQDIGTRYIEIFPSRLSEVRTSSASSWGKTMGYSTVPQRKLESVFDEVDLNESSAAFENENENEPYQEAVEKPREASEYTSSVLLHFVHLRGLPFQADAQDIVNFFAPLKPSRITMEYNSSAKATGEADVYFETHEEAVAAMEKNRSNICR
uniref:G-rich RNA sequence binding factor 1 n=1 Tax=Sphenodon punctatus TaxID=8508 RepID=A0A8D0GT33_SPHPU